MAKSLEILASYVPNLLLRLLADGTAAPDPKVEPKGERVQAAALFVDISGYTAIAEKLARRGMAGIEELSALLNTFFGRLVELIRSHGGDVVKFAGDALIALWPVGVTDRGLPSTLLRAASCAVAIRAVLHDKEIATGVRLSLRVGIGGGTVFAVPVGGVRARAELFVSGEAISQAAGAEQAAARGEVVLSEAAWALVGERCRGEKSERGGWVLDAVVDEPALRSAPMPVLTPAAEPALRMFVPGVVRARMDAGQSNFEAELRRISALFINLPGLAGTASPGLTHRAVCAIQECLYAYEGAVHHVSVDDKGPTVVAAFGLPPQAHEDDAQRAVLAAMDIKAALRALGVGTAVGVATGEAFCGSVGHVRRREYTLVGEMMVRAARLMQAAGDGILADTPSWEGAREKIKFDDPQTIAVKGPNKRMMAYRPRVRRRLGAAHEGASHALVGRLRERDILRRSVSALGKGGPGGVIVLEADHGLGKSHLVDEMIAVARGAGLTVLRGAADAVESATPYYAWRRVLATQLAPGATGGDSMVLQASLLQHLTADPELLPMAPLLNALLPMGLADNDRTAQLSGEVRVSATRDLLVRLVGHLAGKAPLVIVLEDGHWMDSASWALALAVHRRVRPLLLLITLRPVEGAGPGPLDELRRTAGAVNLRLGMLAPDEVAALLCQQLDVDRVPQPLVDLIFARTSGHPHFSLELAFALRDKGIVRVEDGGCRLDIEAGNLASLELPDTVQGLVTGRIDQLPIQPQLALKVASVIGRAVSLRLLREIYPVDADRLALHKSLDDLTRAHLVEPVRNAPEPTWAFRDAITHQVAYNLMLFSQRRTLHQAVAMRYEDVHPAEQPQYYALLAHHWREAGDPLRAIGWLERAGDQAMEGGAWREAADFFGDAIRLDGEAAAAEAALPVPTSEGEGLADPLVRARWERRRGLALVQSGRLGEGQRALERAVQGLGFPLPEGGSGLLFATVAQVLIRVRRALLPVLPLPATSEARPQQAEAVAAYETLSEIHYFNQAVVPTLFTVLRTLNLAELLGPCPELARVQANLALAYSAIPLPRRAAAMIARARLTAETAGGGAARSWVSFVEGQGHVGAGRWDEAFAALARASASQREVGDHRHLTLSLLGSTMVYLSLGRYDAALHTLGEVFIAGERCGDATFVAAALRGKALILLRTGRTDAAIPILERALGLLDANTSRITEVSSRGELAVALWRAGQRDRAIAQADLAWTLIGGSRPTAVNALPAYAGVAELRLAAWEEAKAAGQPTAALRVLATDAVRTLRTFGRIYPLGRALAGLLDGHLSRLRGRLSAATRLWTRALATADQLQMPYEAAMLHQALGEHGPAEGRAAHLAAAAAGMERLRRSAEAGEATEP